MAGIFTPNARITVNHAPVQRAAFEHDLSQRLNANLVQRNEVEWKDLIISPYNNKSRGQSGLVAGMFIVNRYMKFLVRAAPAQRQNVVVFQAKCVVSCIT
ncbi:hypothetical protein FISHEDRAFT_42975 [Fistulina hepatica ATCC 64428]|uniref:Uncharacterized protein n=1 Tax=Fistulina hepatica ATCC 64428 TaxID=1128425 RepID=A0A0D7ADN6_9AGAR|nr:hypothetical protein FISHEDRAFT_42975 [Fistulina hepatica ATCC 64428]